MMGLLVACLVIEILLLLLHLGVVSLRNGKAGTANEAVAGHVERAHNEIRRRGINSLVWEKSLADEPLFFHDSVLTLGQSTATLKLFHQTEVTLSENTLVTIEPSLEREHGEIRLKFTKGSLQARNPYRSARITGEEWTVDLKQGSEVQVRQVGEEDFELQVQKGEAVFKSAAGANDTVNSSEVLRIDGEHAGKLQVDESVQWKEPPPARHYTHADKLHLNLRWTGAADQLVMQTLGRAESRTPAPVGGSAPVELPIGRHVLFLRSGAITSPPLSIEVWRAPVIHLLRPLPRDRAQVSESLQFLWTQFPGVESFRLHAKGVRTELSEKTKTNAVSARLAEPDDLQWSVHGIDPDGFEIPPLYTYPLFIRENPLAPPKLKAPVLRTPARMNEGASHWWRIDRWLLPAAQAEDVSAFEAGFEWEPVPGADQYVIEISETADFRHPVVAKTLSKPRYDWRGFVERAYYWRVAAGTRSGRLGRFSEPVQVDLKDLSHKTEVAGVTVRRVPVSAAKAQPLSSASMTYPPPSAPPPAPEKMHADPAPTHSRTARRRMAAWTPRYLSARLKPGNDEATAKLRGGTVYSLAIENPVPLDEKRFWKISAVYTQARFEPDPRSRYPLQSNLTWRDIRASALYFRSRWGYGLSLRQVFAVKRSGNETLSASSAFGGGLELGAAWGTDRLKYAARAGLLVGSDGIGLQSIHEVRLRVWQNTVLGGGVDGEMISGSSYRLGAFGLLGFEF